MRQFIPWAEPKYWGQEEAFALEALRSSWISGGPFVDRLERDFGAYCGSPFFVATSNGTTAIQAAFLALGVAAGDEIIVPGFAFMAAANIAIHMGAKPVFADIDPNTWCVTADTIEKCITPRTKGVVPVHSYGNMCDMQPILALAEARGIWVLEDAAEAIGSRYRGQHAGTIAPIGTYSFHATKTITTGEGGGVATRDPGLCERMQLYRSHGVKSRRYWHDVAGHNFRLTNMQAAIGCAQIEQIDAIETARREVFARYVECLGGVPGIRMQEITAEVDPIVWAVAVRLDPDVSTDGRDIVLSKLAARGIECRPGFHAAAEMTHLYEAAETPVSLDIARNVLSLPSSPTVTEAEIRSVCQALTDLAVGS